MIYFIQAGDGGPVKIGFCRTRAGVRRRLKGFQTSHAQELYLLGVHPGDLDDEQALHRAFRAAHIRGEWFRPTTDVLFAAESQMFVVNLLDAEQSQDRWRRWGVVGHDGRLTYDGAAWLAWLERQATAEWGYDLYRAWPDAEPETRAA